MSRNSIISSMIFMHADLYMGIKRKPASELHCNDQPILKKKYALYAHFIIKWFLNWVLQFKFGLKDFRNSSQRALWCISRQVLWVSFPEKTKERKEEHLKSCFAKYNGGFIFHSSFTDPLLLCKQLYLKKMLNCDCATFHLYNWLKHFVAMHSILIYWLNVFF